MAALWALVGLTVGALLNLLIYRLPRLERLAGPVVCPRCQVRRPIYAQSSLLSFMLGTRGRCRGCGAAPEIVGVAAEVATGIAFWLLFLRFGASPRLLLSSLYVSLLIVVFFIDWQHRLILNRVTYPAVVVAILLTPMLSPVTYEMTLAGAVVGGMIFGSLYGFGYLVYRQEVLGLGDVKLAMVLGAMTGFPSIVVALLLGSFAGAVAAVAMMASRRRSGRDFMPYGTAMCVGAFASFFLDTPALL